jgi:helicase
MHENITYNPLQLETIQYMNEDTNLVVLAPTSSGKTIVAEQFILPILAKGGRAIYLSPLKALTQEKLDEWSEWPYSLVAITSDHLTMMRPITERMILMTTEALDSKSRGKRDFIQEAEVIVCDEAHLLAVSKRGDAFEVGLTRFTTQNKHARIIFLSATIPNAQELGRWLTSLNGKFTQVIETDWRPVEQEHHLEVVNGHYDWEFNKQGMAIIGRVLRTHPNQQVLIFVHSISKGEMLSKVFNIPFHYSRIAKEKRHQIEEDFRSKKIKCLVSTSTLAWGVNFPADVGIIFGGHRGPAMVDAQDIKQMAGRIGRYGLSEKGYIYYVFLSTYADELYAEISNIPDIHSQLERRMYFHIISLIAREGMDRGDVLKFIGATLYGFQMNSETMVAEHVDRALDTLEQCEALYQVNGVHMTTALGKAASMMYVDPVDLYHLKKNFANKPMTPSLIASALVETPSMEVHSFVPKDLENPMTYPYGLQTVYATFIRDWISGREIGGAGYSVVGPYTADFERMAAALRMAGIDHAYIDSVFLMLKYGIEKHLLELVSLDGIGRKRALGLYRSGVTNKEELMKNETVGRNVLGAALYKKVRQSIEKPNAIFVP